MAGKLWKSGRVNGCSFKIYGILCITAIVGVAVLYNRESELPEALKKFPTPLTTLEGSVKEPQAINGTGTTLGSVKVPQQTIGRTEPTLPGSVKVPQQTIGRTEPTLPGSVKVPQQTIGRTGNGYMVGLHFSDQGTGSFINLMSLLCLSSAVGGVRVVEPFMVGSNVGQDVSANWTQEVKFSDIFDFDEFHRFAKPRGYGSLVPFRTFLEDAPRKLLVAQYKCTGLSLCRTCGHEDILERGRTFAKLNGFEMVGHICLDYGSRGNMNLEQFKNQLYSKYTRSEVVVMFPLFGGVTSGRTTEREGFRLNMSPSKCQRGSVWGAVNHIKPSKPVTASANNYIQRYFGGSSKYMSVMVRFEMVLGSPTTARAEQCLGRLQKKVNEVKSKFGIENTVLCLDVGKYGSKFFREFKSHLDPVVPPLNKFISQTMKEGMNITQLDEMFTNATLITNPGFVAVMQKVIAASGDVLVLLGGGSSYQQSTASMYNAWHKDKHVVKLGNSCG